MTNWAWTLSLLYITRGICSSHLIVIFLTCGLISAWTLSDFHCLCPAGIVMVLHLYMSRVSHYRAAEVDSSGRATCGCGWWQRRRGTAFESDWEVWRETKRSTGGWWEKIGTDSPFNLLINHANEILTGYSEAVLQGGSKALALDYTLSMWRGKMGSKICQCIKCWKTYWLSANGQSWGHTWEEPKKQTSKQNINQHQ